MPYSSGTYTAPSNSFNPAVSNTTVDPTDWAALLADLSTALSTAICKDGQTVTTALVPFGDFGISTSIVKFPATQVPSANANTLDDYEEGSFTPAFTSAGGGSWTYSAQVGRYTKIGNTVSVRIYILITNTSAGSGAVTITGLPFTASTVAGERVGGGLYIAGAGSVNNLSWYLLNTDTVINLRKYTTGTDAALAWSDITNSLEVAIQFTYETA